MDVDFIFKYDSPFACSAIHSGHLLSKEIKNNLDITEKQQFYEEDTFTDLFTDICNNRIIVKTSRFELDLNRVRNQAFYLFPKDAWGLNIRRRIPSPKIITNALENYDAFYNKVYKIFSKLKTKYPRFFIYDIHSFNDRKHHEDKGEGNPDIILGTSNCSPKWKGLIQNLFNFFAGYKYSENKLTVSLDKIFPGGNFPRWVNNKFPKNGCCLAIEFKKNIFMDMETNKIIPQKFKFLKNALYDSFDIIKEYLKS